MPGVTDNNASCTIVRIMVIIGVIATPEHRLPGDIRWGGLAMRCHRFMAMPCCRLDLLTATGMSVAILETVTADRQARFGRAGTFAPPEAFAVFDIRKLKNG